MRGAVAVVVGVRCYPRCTRAAHRFSIGIGP
jgi:hypothetical protein